MVGKENFCRCLISCPFVHFKNNQINLQKQKQKQKQTENVCQLFLLKDGICLFC